MSVLSSRQRILSLWLCRLSTDRLARSLEKARDPNSLVVVYGKRGNAELIVALNRAAADAGLHVGLALAQARVMHPDIVAVEEDSAADTKLLESTADWCLRYTPLVACDGPDGLLLDIAGCAHLYGGEQKLVDDLAARLTRAALVFRVAVAGTIGAAYAAGRFGRPGLHPSGEERTLLSPLPLVALRIDRTTAAALNRVGLKRIGDIIGLPRAPLAARFGADVLRQLDRALGRELEPLNPRLPVASYLAEQRFNEPITRENDVLAVTKRLAQRLKPALEQQGDGARRLELTLFRADGAVRRIETGTSRPLRDPTEIRALFTERLAALADQYDPGFGFNMMRLAVTVAAPCPAEQVGLDSDDRVALDRLIDHLSARLGPRHVRRLVAQDSHIPEIAAATVPAQMKVAGNNHHEGWQALRDYRIAHGVGPRPLRMLPRPEPIQAVAEVPDGPPLRFRWRRELHTVVAAEGPERIESAWWDDTGAPARDYFRVEDQGGLRFWLFRAGLYRNAGEMPQWYLHGAFA
jgi:protein ImuB